MRLRWARRSMVSGGFRRIHLLNAHNVYQTWPSKSEHERVLSPTSPCTITSTTSSRWICCMVYNGATDGWARCDVRAERDVEGGRVIFLFYAFDKLTSVTHLQFHCIYVAQPFRGL